MHGVRCWIGQALAQAELRIKMSQSSVLEHAWFQFEPASPVLNLARNKQWTASKFEMDGLFCLMGQTLAQCKLHIKMSQSSVLEHV
jgi:hypothetical protein